MVTVQVGGLQATLIALKDSTVTVQQAAGPVTKAMGRALKSQVRRRITLRDHSLKQLAAMDHPYAKRHGSIRVHRRKPWQVHTQSGKMVNALMGRPLSLGGTNVFDVTFNYAAAPHARAVIMGTRVMLPRDVLWKTALDPITQKAMMKGAIKTLGKQLKSKLGVRFKSTTPGGTSLAVR